MYYKVLWLLLICGLRQVEYFLDCVYFLCCNYLRFFFRFFLLLIFFDGINFDFDGMEFVFEQQVLFRVDSLFDLRPHSLVPAGEERGQILEHLNFFF